MAGLLRLPGSRRRVPLVLQVEEADCALACLAMLFGYYGHDTTLDELKSVVEVPPEGLSVPRLVRVASRAGGRAKVLRAELEQLSGLRAPVILHWAFNHYVVLERVTKQEAFVNDPAIGRRRVPMSDVDRLFTGIIVALAPEAHLPRRSRRQPWLPTWLRPRRSDVPALTLAIAASLLLEVATALLPLANQVLIDHVLPNGWRLWFFVVMAVLVVASAQRMALRVIRDTVLMKVGLRLRYRAVRGVFERLLAAPATFAAQRSSADLMDRVSRCELASEAPLLALRLLTDALAVVGFCALMCLYSWRLTLLVASVMLLRGVWTAYRTTRLARASAEEAMLGAGELTAAADGLSHAEHVATFPHKQLLSDHFARASVPRSSRSGVVRLYAEATGHVNALLDAFAFVLTLWLGGHAVVEQRLSIGMLAAFITFHALMAAPLGSLVDSARQFALCRGAVPRLQDIFSAGFWREGDHRADLQGVVELQGLSFHYPGSDTALLTNISLQVRAGEHVAVLGPSGAGKSTLMQLIAGLLLPSAGTVSLDGVPVHGWERRTLRPQLAFVPQEPWLFAGTVAENLAWGLSEPDAQTARALWALLAPGCETTRHVGENGRCLSGGQRQLVGLARALARRPRLLVLDEATRHLDSSVQARVLEYVRKLGCTCFHVTHRQEITTHCTRVLVVHDGSVEERPIEACGRPQRLARTA